MTNMALPSENANEIFSIAGNGSRKFVTAIWSTW